MEGKNRFLLELDRAFKSMTAKDLRSMERIMTETATINYAGERNLNSMRYKPFWYLKLFVHFCEAEIKKLQAEFDSESERLKEVKKRLQTRKKDLEELWNRYKEKVIDGDSKEISSVEEDFKNRKIHIQRDEALEAALKEKILNFEKTIDEKTKERNTLFSSLAREWLKKETSTYDANAKKAITSIQRLLACHNLLRGIDSTAIYQEVIGPAYEFLSSVRIPVIKSFDKSDFINSKIYTTHQTKERVFDEIVK